MQLCAVPLPVSSWSGGEVLDLFSSYKTVKILEALDNKCQNTNVSVELVPLDFLKIMLIQVREVKARNVGVTVTVSAASHPCTSENFQVASSPVKKIRKSHCVCCNTANTMCCGICLCV